MNKISSLILLSATVLFSVWLTESCVSRSKFTEQKKLLDRFEDENDSLISANEQLRVSNAELLSRMGRLNRDIQQMRADSVACAQSIADLRKENRQLENRLQETTLALQATKKGAEQESSKLMMQIGGIQNDLQARENELQKLSQELQKLSQELEERRKNLAALEQELDKRNRRMAELERIISRQDSSVKALKNKVSAALIGLENNGLTVTMRNGKVYVSLDEKLLFKSGSITVDPAGVSALKKLVKVLEQNQDISITIEGHTDNVPLSANASLQDNWDLSVKRATSIVRILLDKTKISPSRLTAAGRGEFVPIDAANTSNARQKNRRTEIILMPDLNELYQILE
jgi:chemotaxis protein MotB